MQQVIGILLIIFGIWFFFFTKKNASMKGFDTYITIRRYSACFLSILLGVLLLFDLIDGL